MVVAYALVEASTSEADRLREDIEALEGVETVHVVAGDVDLIARVTVDSPAAASGVITGGIAEIDGVADTETYMSMDPKAGAG